MYEIKLTTEQINVVLYSLQKQPYEYVASTISAMQNQLKELENNQKEKK